MKIILGLIVNALTSVCLAKEVNIADSGITFNAPDEFVPLPLPQEIIDAKWPSSRAPRWVIGNASGATTIAYDIKPNDISAVPLTRLMSHFKTTFNRIVPGIEWIKSEIIEISGAKLVYLEMTSNAIDTDIHNIMLLTSYGKQMLIFNFNSTKEEFSRYESELRNSVETIRLPANANN